MCKFFLIKILPPFRKTDLNKVPEQIIFDYVKCITIIYCVLCLIGVWLRWINDRVHCNAVHTTVK